jgi:hypothetical protein
VKLLNAAVPEKTPVRIYVVNASSNNSFTVKPPNFYHEPGCGNFGTLKTLLTSTSVAVSGKVSLSMTGDFPDPEFGVTAGIYSQSSNALLWSKVYTISKSKSEFDVAANLPAGTQAYLKIQAVKSQNSFENEAISQEFNTTSAQNMNWSFSIKPKFKRVVLNFSFTRSAQLPAGDYPVKIEFTNTLNGDPEGNLVFQVKSNQTEYSSEVFLTNTKRYQLNIRRVDGGAEFMAFPYEFKLGSNLQSSYSFAAELSPVVRKTVRLTVKVVCDKSEIIPSLNGYYRTVWEKDWKEAEIKNGALTITCEMNATYVVGLIVDGKMETEEYTINETDRDFEFKLDDEACGKMGW